MLGTMPAAVGQRGPSTAGIDLRNFSSRCQISDLSAATLPIWGGGHQQLAGDGVDASLSTGARGEQQVFRHAYVELASVRSSVATCVLYSAYLVIHAAFVLCDL